MIYAINTRTTGPTTYEGLTLLGMASHGGALYAVDATRLLDFQGADDDGVEIAAYIETGKMDFGGKDLKRYSRLYIGGTASGGVTATVKTEENGVERSRDYPKAPWLGSRRERAVKLAGGPKSRYLQARIANRDGGSLRLEQAEILVESLGRRI